MNEAKYPSKERVERDGVLIYAEGDDIPASDRDELTRQGYDPDDTTGARIVISAERVERDGVLLYAEGDEVPADVAERLGITTGEAPTAATVRPPTAVTSPRPKRAPAKKKS